MVFSARPSQLGQGLFRRAPGTAHDDADGAIDHCAIVQHRLQLRGESPSLGKNLRVLHRYRRRHGKQLTDLRGTFTKDISLVGVDVHGADDPSGGDKW